MNQRFSVLFLSAIVIFVGFAEASSLKLNHGRESVSRVGRNYISFSGTPKGELKSKDDTKTTKAGVSYTRIRPEELKKLKLEDGKIVGVEKFGEAWQDAEVIWGDTVMKDGKAVTMDYDAAVKHCKSINAELPTQSDFTRLGQSMLVMTKKNFHEVVPQIIPNLTFDFKGRPAGYTFWTSTPHETLQFNSYVYHGLSSIADGYLNHRREINVRCVIRRRRS